MKLYEYEGKNLWRQYGIPVPEARLLTKTELGAESIPSWSGYIVKAQTLSGGRADRGLIVSANDVVEAQAKAHDLFEQHPHLPELEHVLIEQRIEYKVAVYVSLAFSTISRSPVLLLAAAGGTGIESKGETTQRLVIDYLLGLHPANVRQVTDRVGLPPGQVDALVTVIMKLWQCFRENDCLVAEINPLVLTTAGDWLALDAKVELDDDANFRHRDSTFHPRHNLGRLPTAREIAAWQIDRGDHRGVAGSSYIDLDGDVAILASGGGASLACLDALVAYGGRPANYTEYSGNPPRDKVRRLTEIVLSKPGLKGCWVVGATANFTDILETLSGFLDGLRRIHPKPDYPFLIRRAGPHDQKAFALLRQAAKDEGYDFHLFGSETPMISTAAMMMKLYRAYCERHGHSH